MQYFNEFCFSKFFRCSAAIEPEQEPVPEPVKGPEFIPNVGRLARFNFSSFLLKKHFTVSNSRYYELFTGVSVRAPLVRIKFR